MNYSFIPQKVVEMIPNYSNNCPNCNSINTFPLMNMTSSQRVCGKCDFMFYPTIIGYRKNIVEKDIETNY